MDPDDEWSTWIEWLGEGPDGRNIWREVTDMRARREIWDSFAVAYNIAVTNGGPKEVINNPNFPAWIKNNYLDAQIMAVRRQLDPRRDVVSLARLVKRVSRYPHVLSRDRYAVRTAGWQNRAEADQFFDQMVGPGLDHIDRNVAKANFANLKARTRTVVDWAHAEKAHYNEAPRGLGEEPTIGDLHDAVKVVSDVAVKYRDLILGISMSKRVGLLPWTQIFRVAWIPEDQMSYVNSRIAALEAKRERGESLSDEDFR